jgi:hypothetical protein
MADEEDLIITVDSLDDPVDTTEDVTPARKEPAVKLKTPDRDRVTPTRTENPTDNAVASLRTQLDAQKRATDEARRIARDATERERTANAHVEAARTTIADTYGSALDTEIAAAKSESDSLKAAYKAAMEAGNFEEVSEINIKIADARARLNEATREKNRLTQETPVTRAHEGAVREREPQRQEVRRVPQTDDERREAILAGCTPKTRAWLEAHIECVDNPVKAAKANLVHQEAIEQGIVPDSPEYFRYAEEQMGYTKVTRAARQSDNADSPRTNGARRVVESAPVDRGGSGSGGGDGFSGEQVSLTREEARMATDGTMLWNSGPKKGQPIGTKEFARRKILIKRGEAGPLRYASGD